MVDSSGVFGEFGDGTSPRVTIRISDKILYWRLLYNPSLTFGEAYTDGRITFEEGDLRDLLHLAFKNWYGDEHFVQRLVRLVHRVGSFVLSFFRIFQQANRLRRSHRNVSHHYDLGNDFYELFLDKNLLYSCAYFEKDSDSLESAQRAKLRLISSKLLLEPGQRVLDIGCGWGDMAFYLASMCDVHVVGITLSAEQHRLATERSFELGLNDRVEFRLEDYRNVGGKFDRIVSVGMFEHVGVPNYNRFFSKVRDLLTDDGIMLLHSIGDSGPIGVTDPWIRKYIFPGGYIPSLSEVYSSLEASGLWCLDMEALRLHYAKTLLHWETRFQKNRAKIEKMYDERFARMWEFYLVASEASFLHGTNFVFHMQLSPKRDASPLTRDYMTATQKDYKKRESKKLPPL